MRIVFLSVMFCLLAHCSPVSRVSEVPPPVEGEQQLTEAPQQQTPPRTPEELLEIFNRFLDQG